VTDCRAGYGWLAPMVMADLLGCAVTSDPERPGGPGTLMRADGGIVFLYEAVELSLEAQRNVLRLIERGEVQAVGSATPTRANVRVLASTCDQVERAVARGLFHETLYERLRVNTLRVPPVRGRREDIPLLVDRARRQHNARFGLSITGLTPEALAILEAYEWPGNLEEMEALLLEAMVLQGSGQLAPFELPPSRPSTRDLDLCRCCCVRGGRS
jgi:DNA-binding NtrC family response regulator